MFKMYTGQYLGERFYTRGRPAFLYLHLILSSITVTNAVARPRCGRGFPARNEQDIFTRIETIKALLHFSHFSSRNNSRNELKDRRLLMAILKLKRRPIKIDDAAGLISAEVSRTTPQLEPFTGQRIPSEWIAASLRSDIIR